MIYQTYSFNKDFSKTIAIPTRRHDPNDLLNPFLKSLILKGYIVANPIIDNVAILNGRNMYMMRCIAAYAGVKNAQRIGVLYNRLSMSITLRPSGPGPQRTFEESARMVSASNYNLPPLPEGSWGPSIYEMIEGHIAGLSTSNQARAANNDWSVLDVGGGAV